MRKVLIATCAAFTMAVAATSAAAGTAAFHTPSKRIYCIYFTGPTTLRCDTMYRTSFTGKKKCREGDYGQAFGMSPRGGARPLCVSDSTHVRGSTVRYGTTHRFGPYTCRSRRAALTCSNRSGHGWTLSRERQRLF